MITVGLFASSKEWIKFDVGSFIVYAKNDSKLHFNYFGFLKRYDICKPTFMYLSFSTMDLGFKNIKAKDLMVKFNFSNGEESFSISSSVYKVKYGKDSMLRGIESLNFLMGNKFLQFLNKSKNITVSIDKNDKMSKYFSFSTSHFNVEGFYKAYQKEYNQCLKHQKKVKKQ